MSSKSRKYGGHTQFAFTGYNLALKVALPVNPGLWQRTAKAIKISHTVPRKMRRPAKVGTNLIVGHTHFFPNLLPHRLLSREGKGHVNAIQGHPIYKTFPFRPFPPYHRITVCAVIEKKSHRNFAAIQNRLLHTWKVFGHLHRLVGVPRNINTRVFF